MLPSLAKHYQTKNYDGYSKLLDWGLRLTFLLALPAALALAILAVPLITTLFHYGQFSEHDVWMTRSAVMAYSLGLTGLILVKILAPGFYAQQNIKTPVKIGVITLVVTQVLNALLIFPLQHAGLALATGLGACFNAGFLFYKLRQHEIYQPQLGWTSFFAKLAIALVVMAALLWWFSGPDAQWLILAPKAKVVRLGSVILGGGCAYLACLWLLGMRFRDFARRSS